MTEGDSRRSLAESVEGISDAPSRPLDWGRLIAAGLNLKDEELELLVEFTWRGATRP